jgi:hypothetical protein
MPREPSTENIGCRACGSRLSKVVNTWARPVTWHGVSRTIVKRRRICAHCGLPFNTIETYEDEELADLPDVDLAALPPNKLADALARRPDYQPKRKPLAAKTKLPKSTRRAVTPPKKPRPPGRSKKPPPDIGPNPFR